MSVAILFIPLHAYLMKKIELFPDSDGKLIAVFQDESLQFGNILTSRMVHHHEMKSVVFGIMACTIEE